MNSYDVGKAIRGAMPFSAIVDIDGVFNPKTGGFHLVQDAIDSGHKSIFIRAGTYPSFNADVVDLFIMGESWDVVIDGTTVDDAIDISAARVRIRNLIAQTTGGSGNAYDGIDIASGGADADIDTVYIPDSDDNGILSAARCRVHNCVITSCDGDGIDFAGTGDDSIVLGNYIHTNGAYGTTENAAAENIVYVGNRVTGNSSGQINQASGTGTYSGNDET